MIAHTSKDVARILKDERKRLSKSQGTVATCAGVRQSTVSKVERDPDNTRLETLFSLLAALDLELEIKPKTGLQEPGEAGDESW